MLEKNEQQDTGEVENSEENPLGLIPLQYKGLPAEVLEEMWTPPIYTDPEKNKVVQENRKRAIEALKIAEAKYIVKPKEGNESKTDSLGNLSLQIAKRKIFKELKFPNPDFQLITKLLRDGLTTRGSFSEMMEKDDMLLANGFVEEKKSYKEKIENLAKSVDESGMKWDGNPAWFGINTVPEKSKTKEINRKFYVTLPTSSLEFVDHIKDLAVELRKLALQTGDIIQVKIPNTFSGFLAHRDSVVIHFKDSNNTDSVRDVFDKWKNQFGVSEEERELGRTHVAADSKETSFSDLVAEAMTGYLRDNLGKYDTDALLDKAIEHAVILSQKGPTIVGK